MANLQHRTPERSSRATLVRIQKDDLPQDEKGPQNSQPKATFDPQVSSNNCMKLENMVG